MMRDLEQLRNDPTTQYIGDGVYARHDGYQIWLCITDGISVQGEIALDPSTYVNLRHYAKTLWADA